MAKARAARQEGRLPRGQGNAPAVLQHAALAPAHQLYLPPCPAPRAVYLAQHNHTAVAVKVLMRLDDSSAGGSGSGGTGASGEQAAALSAPELRAMLKEAELMASVRHPHVVQLLAICERPPAIVSGALVRSWGGLGVLGVQGPVLAVAAQHALSLTASLACCLLSSTAPPEFCARGSLTDVLQRARSDAALAAQLGWERRLRLALGAAKGMLALHAHSPPILHKDLKAGRRGGWRKGAVGGQRCGKLSAHVRTCAPLMLQGPNLLVDEHFRCKVSDFNLSRVRVADSGRQPGQRAGGRERGAGSGAGSRRRPRARNGCPRPRSLFPNGQVVEEGLGASKSTAAPMNPRWLAPELIRGGRASAAGAGRVGGAVARSGCKAGLARLQPSWLSHGPCPTTPALLPSTADVFSYGVVLWGERGLPCERQGSRAGSGQAAAGARWLPDPRTLQPPCPPPVELLTWELPWNGVEFWEIVSGLMHGKRPPVPPREHLPGPPADNAGFAGLDAYCALMRRCWEQEAGQRPPFGEVCAELQRLLGERGAAAAGADS